jgi:hypothetical protein
MKEEAQNIVKLKCYHFWSDWTTTNYIEIDLDKYKFFQIDYRCDSFHLIGFYKVDDNWLQSELSDHGIVGIQELAKFISIVGSSKINKIVNYHNSKDFLEKINILLEKVELTPKGE